jgi:hypothetical protein
MDDMPVIPGKVTGISRMRGRGKGRSAQTGLGDIPKDGLDSILKITKAKKGLGAWLKC